MSHSDSSPVSARRAVIERYFELIADFETRAEAYADVLHPEMQYVEYPNAVNPGVRQANLEQMMQAAAAGKALLAQQQFSIVRCHDAGETLIVEARWAGRIGTARSGFQPGQSLEAYLCMVFEFSDGRIRRQSNYDCYVPFAGN